jgi:hypothetical protein
VASPSRRAPRLLAHTGRPRVPRRAALYKSHRRAGREPQTLTTPGEPPLSSHAVHRRSRWRRRRKRGEKPPVGESLTAKPGAARGRSRTRRERLLPLLPLPHRRRAAAYLLFFLAGQPLRRSSPTRSTSASGHRGEDAASSLLWTPRPSSRGGTPAAPRRRW